MSKFDKNTLGNALIKADGKIIIKLQEAIDKKGTTKYVLPKKTNIRYDITVFIEASLISLLANVSAIFLGFVNETIDDETIFTKASNYSTENFFLFGQKFSVDCFGYIIFFSPFYSKLNKFILLSNLYF